MKIYSIASSLMLLVSMANTQGNMSAKICNNEIKKEQPNKKRLQKYCTQAGEYYHSNRNNSSASWYYLVGGKNDKNIEEIQNSITSYSTYRNIGHSYVLKGELRKAENPYSKFLRNSSIPWADKVIQANYKLLNKLYPEEKENLKRGLALWDKIYTPLIRVNTLDGNFKKARKARKHKEAIKYLIQVIVLQKKYQEKDNTGIRNNLYRLGVVYSYDRQYKKSLKTLQEVETAYPKTSHNSKNYSDLLVWIANDYEKLQRYNKAIEYRKKSLGIEVMMLGEEHASMAKRYNNMGVLYYKTGAYPEALAAHQKALAITIKIYGENHVSTAASYSNMGLLYKSIGDYSRAMKYYQKALTIQGEILGKRDADTAINYNNLAMLYQKIGEYPKALKYARKALAIKEEVLGGEHSSTLTAYSNLGTLYKALGDYPEALKYYNKALGIKEKVSGIEHTDTAVDYGKLAMLYDAMGDYHKALEYAQKSLAITEKALGEEHPTVITGYSNLAFIYFDIGDYSKAVKYHQKASVLTEKILGKEHIETAASYNNLGFFYYNMGDYSKALEYYHQALSIKEKILGKNDIATAISYNNLGGLYQKAGNYTEAMKYYQKALSTREKVLGKKHISTAESYNNMGAVSKALKDSSEAMKYYQKALSIQNKVLQKDHPSTATSYANLSLLYQAQSNYPKALEYSQKALTIREKVLGKEHTLTALSYNSQGWLYLAMKDYPKAHHYAQLAFDNFLINREKVFTILDSKQKEKYLKTTTGYITSLLSSAYQYIRQLNKEGKNKKAQQILRSGANAWLNYKGSIFDSENAIAMLYSSTKDKKIKAKIDELVSSKRYLAKLYQSLPKPKEREAWKNNIKKTKEKISKLTNEISSKATSFKEQQGLKSITYKDIISHLKKNELYIDYAKAGEYYYLFTLDHKDNIEFVQIDKKNTKKIDSLVKSFRDDVTTILNDKKITDIKLKVLTESSKEKLTKLYDLAIKIPLGNTIKSKISLIISPDGALRLLPFETLYDKEKSKYFIEEKEIRYIPSGKELVRLHKYSKDKVSKAKKSAVIFANPNFDTKISSISKEEIAITPNTSRSGIIKSLFRMRFAPLPGTEAEAKAIKATLNKNTVSEYQENKATESTLMKIKEPHILHIATHGFFINDTAIPNPMLKSGIALAGANTSAIKGKSDGIVTALKLSGLDLKGSDLVVLSACQTGVVDINATDSVSGLSKAFIQAGAKDIVMSLWSVDDEATKELMTSFYQEMKEKKSYAKALKAAKLKMIEEGRHPFYWGAFVVSGL